MKPEIYNNGNDSKTKVGSAHKLWRFLTGSSPVMITNSLRNCSTPS